VDTLTAALWYLLTSEDYRQTVLKAVNLGGDTHTAGIVARRLADVHGDLAAVPYNWRDRMSRAADLTAVFERFSASCPEPALNAHSNWPHYPSTRRPHVQPRNAEQKRELKGLEG
jgi:hypothetical protein